MADPADKDSKTEEATEKKVRDSLDKGQIPYSKETPIFASFVAALLFAMFFAHDTAVRLSDFLSTFLEKPDEWVLGTNADAVGLYQLVFMEMARALMVMLAMIVAFGLGSSLLQNPPQFVGDRIMPKMERISIAKGWSRVFGAKGFAEFAKSVAKVVFTSAFLVLVLRDSPARLLSGMSTNPAAFGIVMLELATEMLVTITLVMALISVADLVWSRFHWRSDMRMTKQEVKDEHKQSDGDPAVKARIRSLQRDRARQRMMAAVPQATLVIVNPTHYAIALRYVRDKDAAPVVVAKGQDLIALRIREIATEHKIPVFEDVTLARSMYSQVSVDSVIPAQFYQAVAELVRIIYGNAAKNAPGIKPA